MVFSFCASIQNVFFFIQEKRDLAEYEEQMRGIRRLFEGTEEELKANLNHNQPLTLLLVLIAPPSTYLPGGVKKSLPGKLNFGKNSEISGQYFSQGFKLQDQGGNIP